MSCKKCGYGGVLQNHDENSMKCPKCNALTPKEVLTPKETEGDEE